MAALLMIHHPGPACANITVSSLLARQPVKKSQVTPSLPHSHLNQGAESAFGHPVPA